MTTITPKTLIINLLMFISLFPSVLEAQVYGCTDSQATNFNPSATNNDGSCLYNATSVTPTSSNNLAANLNESSGLAFWNSQFWTHNDNLDANIYSLNPIDGTIIQTYPLGITNTDWEEISQDNDYVYIGDFGNNANGNRTDLKIYKISKSSILASAPIIETINFSYSNQSDFTPTGGNNTNFDCEAFIVTNDKIYLFTKQWTNHQTSLYSLDKTPGTHSTTFLGTINVQGLITGATYREADRIIALSGYDIGLQPFSYLLYDFNAPDFFGGNKRKIGINLTFHQVEGIASNSGTAFYITNEHFANPPFVNNPQKLQSLDFNSFLGTYLSIDEHKVDNKFLIYPNPTNHTITLEIPKQLIGEHYSILDSQARTIVSGTIQLEKSTIDVEKLPNGLYLIQINQMTKSLKFIKN
ncbi:MAG: T9SS type A sorting domain-containing protein [Bacteroidota bacterium]